MPPDKSALDQFNEDFGPLDKNQLDPFNESVKPTEKVEEGEPEAQIERKKNRHERRLEAKLQAEREANIEMAARLRALHEAKEEDKTPVSPDIARIYGTDTPEAREATRILQAALEQVRTEAEENAFRRLSETQQKEIAEQREAESFIDNELEALEDEYNLDLTSDKPEARKARSEFLSLVEKLSPKDEAGNVTDYADFDEVFEIYQGSREKQPTRAKELASRSMTKSGASPTQPVNDKVTQDYLRSIGII